MSEEKPTNQSATTQAPLHTPGPWSVIIHENEYGDISYHIDEPITAYTSTERAEANKSLIAAAPDLLAAAKDSLRAFGNGRTVTRAEFSALEALAVAIEKAEGK